MKHEELVMALKAILIGLDEAHGYLETGDVIEAEVYLQPASRLLRVLIAHIEKEAPHE